MAVCREFTAAAPAGVIIREPYLPYVPDPWNGILVLAEAQQLASAVKYRQRLEGLSSDERVRRLYVWLGDGLGVRPWDDGSIKLGLKAMRSDLRLEEVAVSNAVPWSCAEGKANRNPTDEMRQAAVAFWHELLAVWEPEIRAVVTVGKTARLVMKATGFKAPVVLLRSSSRCYMNQVRGLFCLDDLLERFPEVAAAADAVGIQRDDDKEFYNKVFFACHAASVGRWPLADALKGQ